MDNPEMQAMMEPLILATREWLDQQCDPIRKRLIGDGDSIAEEYRISLVEANLYQDTGVATADFQEMADVQGMTLDQLASGIIYLKEQGDLAVKKLRNIRLKYKTQVSNCSSPEQLDAIVIEFKQVLATFVRNLPEKM